MHSPHLHTPYINPCCHGNFSWGGGGVFSVSSASAMYSIMDSSSIFGRIVAASSGGVVGGSGVLAALGFVS